MSPRLSAQVRGPLPTLLILFAGAVLGLSLATPGIGSAESGVRFEKYYTEVPDYSAPSIFESPPGGLVGELRRALAAAPVAGKPCGRGVVTPTAGDRDPRILKSNVCEDESFAASVDV